MSLKTIAFRLEESVQEKVEKDTYGKRGIMTNEIVPVGAITFLPVRLLFGISLNQDNFQQNGYPVQRKTELLGNHQNLIGNALVSGSSVLPKFILAEDVHSERARLSIAVDTEGEASPSPFSCQLQLTFTQTYAKGDILPVWFSSELASQLGMPFLNFSHIKGKGYSCEDCGRNFGVPNRLKLHIASSCDSQSSDDLWGRAMKAICGHYFKDFPSNKKICKGLFNIFEQSPTDSSNHRLESRDNNEIRNEGWKGCDEKHHSPDSSSLGVYFRPDNLQRLPNDNSDCEITANKQSNSRTNSAFTPVQGRANTFTCHTDYNLSPLSKFPDAYHNFLSLYRLNHLHSGSNSSYSSVFLPPLLNQQLWGISHPHYQFMLRNNPIKSLHHDVPKERTMELLTSSNCKPIEQNLNSFAEMEVLVSNLGKNKGRHICVYCGKAYSRKYGLKIHTRTHTGYKPLKCRVCFRPFGDPSNLNKHVRLHAQGDTPYRCKYCSKVLVRRRDLDRHIRSRHAEITTTK